MNDAMMEAFVKGAAEHMRKQTPDQLFAGYARARKQFKEKVEGADQDDPDVQMDEVLLLTIGAVALIVLEEKIPGFDADRFAREYENAH